MRQKLLAACLFLLIIVAYLPTIHFGLVYDDFDQLLNNPRITAWSYVPGYFTTHLWSQMAGEAPHYYRPIFLLWFRLLESLIGAPGSFWHWSSIAAHLCAVGCVFLLCRRLCDSFYGALIAAALFALHPVNTEAVAWISASDDVLLTIFLTLSVLFYAQRKQPISFVSVALAALAMFTKETGIVAPALIFAYEWIHSRWKNALLNTAPYLLACLLYFAFRVNAIGSPMVVAAPKMSLITMVLTWPRLLAFYGSHLLWPMHLSLAYDFSIEQAFWPLLLLFVLVVAALWLLKGACANVRFGAAWFFLTLAPALAIRYIDARDYVHDRYLYLPSVGLALIAAALLGRTRLTRPRIVAISGLMFLLVFGIRLNLPIWQDNIALFSRVIETAPRNPYYKNDLAKEYIKAHREPEAYPLLQQVIAMNPGFPGAYENLAYYYQQVGDMQEAQRCYLKSVELRRGQAVR